MTDLERRDAPLVIQSQHTPKELAARMRAHVVNRGGLSKDENGDPVVPNGAWAMMLEAADKLDAIAAAPALWEALAEALVSLNHARTFIASRERMHPDGIALHDECIAAAAAALNAATGAQITSGDEPLSAEEVVSKSSFEQSDFHS